MAIQPRLKIAIADYGHTRAVKSKDVPIEDIEPDFIQVVPIIGAFRRMVRDHQIDYVVFWIEHCLKGAQIEVRRSVVASIPTRQDG